MGYLIAFVIVCAICGVIGAAAEGEEKKQAKAAEAAVPEAFSKLFKEEFPEFAGDMTYVTAERFIEKWNAGLKSKQYTRHLNWSGSKFKNSASESEAARGIISETAGTISNGFRDSAMENPSKSYEKIRAIMTSSAKLAGK